MEQVTIERAGAKEGSSAFLTWRDAASPVTRASRRRWVAIGVLVLLAIGVTMAWGVDLGYRTDSELSPSLTSLLVAGLLFGVLRQSTGRLAALDHPELDERDLGARNAAFRLAYPLLIVIVGASAVTVALSTDEFNDTMLYGLLLWAALWAVFLPMAVLAWREPDALGSEAIDPAEGAGAPEPVSDAIVVVTFAAALALSLPFHEGTWALVALVAGLTVLAGWKRWAVGQQAVANVIGNVGAGVAAVGLVMLVGPLLLDSVDLGSPVAPVAAVVGGLALVTLSGSGLSRRGRKGGRSA